MGQGDRAQNTIFTRVIAAYYEQQISAALARAEQTAELSEHDGHGYNWLGRMRSCFIELRQHCCSTLY